MICLLQLQVFHPQNPMTLLTSQENILSSTSNSIKKVLNSQRSTIEDLNISKNTQERFLTVKSKYISAQEGLLAKSGDLPSNRRFWRASSTFQRNGIFNVHTHHFNTRSMYPFFFTFLLYGWWGHATFAWYKMRYEDNDEWIGNFYDKLNTRFPPASKIWLRPG